MGTWRINLIFHITSIALEKCEKECNMLKIILVQGFCPLKIKITQFPDGFRLNCSGADINQLSKPHIPMGNRVR